MRATTASNVVAACTFAIAYAWLVSATALGQERSAQLRIPRQFKPVDTSKVLGSPNPLPLVAEKAFPELKFERPVELTHAGDGTNRVFVVEQRGMIYVFENRPDVAERQEFLDIREAVLREGNEEGLLGLAFHPKYKENGEFFVYYSARPRKSVISRFRVSNDDPNKADRESEEVILEIDQPFSNHNGGSIKFGPDGYLYIGLGDGGARDDPHANAQDLSTWLGSILRIDIDRQANDRKYAIPDDNPFVERRNARGEIWAYGLRNVWRLAFDRKSGDLYAADVGQDRFEEVNLIVKGGNYGWPFREGKHDFQPSTPEKFDSFIEPLNEYFRGDGQSVTGGVVYRGKRLPEYDGAYFYGDYLSGRVWALRQENNRATMNTQVARTGLEIAAFGEDEQGEMYLCAFDGYLYQFRERENIEQIAKAFPRKLSETGFFASVEKNELVEGVIPYELNMPFWSDYTVKDRYIALPEKGTVEFHEDTQWDFPVGTVFIKTFWMHRDRVNLAEPFRLETRLLIHDADEGWHGVTYVYNDDETEAHLVDTWLDKAVQVKTADGEIQQRYYFPSRTDCITCHTKAANFALGLNTRQMNRSLHFHGESENQIKLLSDLGVFKEPVEKSPDDLERYPNWKFGNFDRSGEGKVKNTLDPPEGDIVALARSWLDVNCANCHRPEGIAPLQRDLRWGISLDRMNLVGREPTRGSRKQLGTEVLKPGRPFESELLLRLGLRGMDQMPPLGTHRVDPRGHEVVRRWIEELGSEPATR
jgi:uncharacterized repeat protein (TIGR03806 family)